METWLLLNTLMCVFSYLSALGFHAHGVVNPLRVSGDNGVYSGLLNLATLLPSIRSDAHCHTVVKQRTSRVTLKEKMIAVD